jgi:hypothetical protein
MGSAQRNNFRHSGGIACQVGSQRMIAQESETDEFGVPSGSCGLWENHIHFCGRSLDQLIDVGVTLGVTSGRSVATWIHPSFLLTDAHHGFLAIANKA